MSLKFYDYSKALLYINEFESKTPVFLEFDPSMACNQNCCWCRYGHDDSMLSYEFMIKKLAKYPKVRGIRITGGGEPLMNPATIPFIKECFHRGMTVGIETNGSLLDKDSIDVISRCCRYCRISLDAGCAETYSKLHHSNSFETVVANIRKLNEARVRELGISYLVVAKNVQDIKLLPKLILPVDYFHFKPLIDEGTNDETKKESIGIIENNSYFKVVKTRYDRLIKDEDCNNKLPCRITELIRRIGGDGKEYTCCEKVYQPEFEVGVWNGDTSSCVSCRYNGYNEILESYYSDSLTRRML
jgi:MoaA/NifB/PqqE/SkfB family radical SAM enzyme